MTDFIRALSRRTVIVLICVVGLVLAGASVLFRSTGERGAVTQTAGDAAPPAATPPIDAAAPAETETATFALG